ncbi:hypothetical protein F0L68_00705 [Solihabitans fulvus]|uniref:FtsK/SpoIIIE family protein n=1 Tax=Solihabitans fulvus TaxID=1892852 RepID=A0A5B2XVA9_9PSEU|nr:hypothetical protein [Solihabitans fulvus]KAA2267085.1 hypothetical protein F0L68_00705 [Solihabitans fulvus]
MDSGADAEHGGLPTDRLLYPHPMPEGLPYLSVPFGIDTDGRPAYWDLRGEHTSTHLLILGDRRPELLGLLRSLVIGVTRHSLATCVLDTTGTELRDLDDWAGTRVAHTATELAALLALVRREFLARLAAVAGERLQVGDLPRVVVIVDQAEELDALLAEHCRDGERPAGQSVEALRQIAVVGSRVNMHLVVVNPPADWLTDPQLRRALPDRIVLGPVDPRLATALWDDPTIGVDPASHADRGLLVGADRAPRKVRCWWTPWLRPDAHDDGAFPRTSAEIERVRLLRRGPYKVKLLTETSQLLDALEHTRQHPMSLDDASTTDDPPNNA